MASDNDTRFQAIINNIIEGYYECDLAGNFTYSNESFARIFGRNRDDIIGLNYSALLNPDDSARLGEIFTHISRTSQPVKRTSLTNLTDTGDMRHFETSIAPIVDGGDTPTGFRGIMRDVTNYRKAQDALMESEKIFRDLVERANDVIYRNDAQGNFKYINSYGIAKLGYSLEEFTKLNYINIIPDEYREGVLEFYRTQLLDSTEQTYHELPILKKDGSIIWIGQYVTRAVNAHGEVEFYGIARDITDVKAIQDALIESEDKYRTFLESISEGYYQVDLRGNIIFVNNAITSLTGYSRDEIVGKSYAGFFTDATSKKILEVFAQVFQTGESVEFSDWEVLRKDGRKRIISASVELVFTKTRRKSGFRGMIRDITEKKHYIDALIDSERKLRDLVEYLPEMVFELDSDGIILYINKRATELLGYAREELMGRNAFDIVAPEHRQRAMRGFGKTLGGKRYSGEGYTFQGKDRKIPVHLYTTPIEESGITIGIRGIAIDISSILDAENAIRGSEEKFRTMIEHSSEIISILDTDGVIRYESHSVTPVLGYTQQERLGTSALAMVHPEDREQMAEVLKRSATLRNGELAVIKYRYRHSNGSWRHLESTGSNLMDNPLIQGILLNTRDVTESRLAEKAMKKREEKYRRLYNNALVGMVTVDYPTMTILETNDLGYRIFGYDSCADIIGNALSSVFADPEDLTALIRRLDAQGEAYNVEVPLLNRKGEKVWSEISAKKDDENRELRVVIADISKRKQAEELLTYYTFYDQLTQLPNREMFSNKLHMEIVKSQRHGREKNLAVMCLGLDRFKNINEMHGPALGDRLLQKFAAKLRSSFREDDLVSRLDGDKFMLLFSELGSAEGIVDVVQKTFAVFSDPFLVDGNVFHITASIGVSIFPHDGNREETLMRNAETAMYHAKGRGRNTYYLYDEQMNREIIKRIKMEEELQHAIFRNEFIAHYQPKVTRDGRIIGMESLIRWHSPQRGLVPPFEFIPLAEKNGMIEEIGNIILYQSCIQNYRWQEKGFAPMRVAVNLSPYQFNHPEMVTSICRVLKETRLDPQWLELEITESGIMSNEKESIEKLNELTSLGLSISIDDFGTGYSSLSKLKDYPIDMLKIDKSFIDHLPHNSKSATIATTIIDLAHNLGFRVVAEGVEKEDQLEFLVKNNCDYYQGYYFSKPLSTEDFEKRIRA
ncbi:MAG: PAS domain S-box protein [Spirochaetes bacterium]|nr:PAS domain S-box protein [Spirochaetota bacterium]